MSRKDLKTCIKNFNNSAAVCVCVCGVVCVVRGVVCVVCGMVCVWCGVCGAWYGVCVVCSVCVCGV